MDPTPTPIGAATRFAKESPPRIGKPAVRFASCCSLADLRAALAELPPPVIVFNKSHSGSRVVARLLAEAGVFMGAMRNESEDATALLPLVQMCVEDFYPDYSRVESDASADAALARCAADALARHLDTYVSGAWGWKLCETTYALPLLARLFPGARYIHVIRDGRDVAFANHVPPKQPFWQKIYADAVGIRYWNGLFFGRFSRTFYRLVPHRYNTQHWINSVTLGRRYGAMLGTRYLELRYEDLCRDFTSQARRLCAFAGADQAESAIATVGPGVTDAQIGRHRREPAWKRRDVLARARPLLIELGYIEGRP